MFMLFSYLEESQSVLIAFVAFVFQIIKNHFEFLIFITIAILLQLKASLSSTSLIFMSWWSFISLSLLSEWITPSFLSHNLFEATTILKVFSRLLLSTSKWLFLRFALSSNQGVVLVPLKLFYIPTLISYQPKKHVQGYTTHIEHILKPKHLT